MGGMSAQHVLMIQLVGDQDDTNEETFLEPY
jgi:hypothetical protein